MTRWRAEARILDANLNRAREAARVAEEYARFALDCAESAGRLKALRHGLHELSVRLDGATGGLASARDTPGDVGTRLTADGEERRGSASEVADAAMKRLEEALRSIEEYAKPVDAGSARRARELRYEAYAVESLLAGPRGRVRLDAARLYVIVTGGLCGGRDVCEVAAAAIRGGAGVIQLREKEMEGRALLECARRLRRVTADAGALFVVNDRVDVAAASDADGVHLGQSDLPWPEARRLLGRGVLIGASAHSMAEAKRAESGGADYIGAGTVFATDTRPAARLAGPEFVRRVTRRARVPVYAIGGITAENVRSVVRAGARRVAVCRAVIGAKDVEAAARRLCAALAAPKRRPDGSGRSER